MPFFLLIAYAISWTIWLPLVLHKMGWSGLSASPYLHLLGGIGPMCSGLIMAAIFAVCGLYALAGAGTIRPLPLLRLGLLGIGGIYTLRGLLIIPAVLIATGILQTSETIPPQGMASSLISLFIGIVTFAGTIFCWRELASRAIKQPSGADSHGK